MIETVALIVLLSIALFCWWDWYTGRELDREIARFFDDHE